MLKRNLNDDVPLILGMLDDVDDLRRDLEAQTSMAAGWSLSALITRLDQIRNLHARLKEIAADVHQLSELLSTSLVPEAMRNAGFTTVNHEIGRVSISSRISASMVEKHGAIAWLKAHDLGELVIETVNSNTLSAQAKAMLEAGEELPSEHFKITTKTQTSITHPGPKRTRKFRPLDDDDKD
jgi:hypothetical protein